METIVAIGLIGYSVYQVINSSNVETNLVWYAQTIASGLGGICYLVYTHLDKIKSLIPVKTNDNKVQVETKVVPKSAVFSLDESDIFTLTSMAHLQARLGDNKEGLDHLSAINDIIFNMKRQDVKSEKSV